MDERKRSWLDWVTPGLIFVALCGGGGALVQAHYDEKSAVKAKTTSDAELTRTQEAAEKRITHLTELLEAERREHTHDSEHQHRHLAALTTEQLRVRHGLEALLRDSRTSGEVCLARSEGIAEAVGDLLDSIGEGAGLLKEVRAENERLAKENHRLAEQVIGWNQDYDERHPQRITVTGEKQGR